MDNDINNSLRELFSEWDKFPTLDTTEPKYDFEGWNYVGKVHVRRYLRRSFAYKYLQGELIYGIFNYYSFYDNEFNNIIIIHPNELQDKLKDIIYSGEDDWIYN